MTRIVVVPSDPSVVSQVMARVPGGGMATFGVPDERLELGVAGIPRVTAIDLEGRADGTGHPAGSAPPADRPCGPAGMCMIERTVPRQLRAERPARPNLAWQDELDGSIVVDKTERRKWQGQR